MLIICGKTVRRWVDIVPCKVSDLAWKMSKIYAI